jgi:hypothetical protein
VSCLISAFRTQSPCKHAISSADATTLKRDKSVNSLKCRYTPVLCGISKFSLVLLPCETDATKTLTRNANVVVTWPRRLWVMSKVKKREAPIWIVSLFYTWPPLWSSGQSFWLQIHRSGFDSRRYQIFWEVVGLKRPPLWSSGQSYWIQIRRPGFDSRHYQKKKKRNVVGLERGALSLVSTNWGATW